MKTDTEIAHARRQKELGFCYGLIAYLWWGFIPIYFHLLMHVPAMIVLGHRVVWSCVLLGVLSWFLVRREELMATLRDRRVMVLLSFSTVLLAANWGTFIYAVGTGRVVQASLGYFINPLVSVVLGVTLLKERLRVGQMVGLGLAVIGVVVITIERGQLPGIALVVAFSFAGYGLMRKIAHVAPMPGLAIETALLLPVALVYLGTRGREAIAFDGWTWGLILLSGLMTVTPLLAFTAAMRRLRLSTMGFLQYVGPTCQFCCGVFLYGEHVRPLIPGFVCIWIALVVYSIDSVRGYRLSIADPSPA